MGQKCYMQSQDYFMSNARNTKCNNNFKTFLNSHTKQFKLVIMIGSCVSWHAYLEIL